MENLVEKVELIKTRLAGYQTELNQWNELWEKIKNNKNSTTQPYIEMVVFMQNLHIYQMIELKWVLKNIFNVIDLEELSE